MTRLFTILIFCSLFVLKIHCDSRIGLSVTTKLGVVRGLNSDNGEYVMFLGVPYGVVNESNPFGSSLPHPGFKETFNAYNDSTICPQSDGVNHIGEIQCLQLNVYVPNPATSADKLPIMVWIRATISPDFLVSKGVIMVTLHYRLGVYGYLCLDTPNIPGNQGFKDQILGFKWIYENINAFGGDENKITIVGQSAGAMAVNLHLLTNQGDYFHRAIILSGPALSPWVISEANRSIPIDIANSLGYKTQDFNAAVTFLLKENPQSIVQKAFEVDMTNSKETHIPSTKVCIEKEFDGVENFLVDYPMNINSTKVQSVPVIIGFVTNNELAFAYANAPKEWFENYSYERMLEYDMKGVDSDIVDILEHFYTGDKILGDNLREEITDFASDYIFNYPTERMLQNLLQNGAKAIFHYVFSYVGKRNYLKLLLNLQTERASHGDDLGYIFNAEVLTDRKDDEDMRMVEILTTLWTNFVKYGEVCKNKPKWRSVVRAYPTRELA
ncbi:hypothetical protein K1T71_014860 [Dendrolimus kikuchii]|nr:hypothetical protein K1T71_014860 [Dendrolimus kikuchii]